MCPKQQQKNTNKAKEPILSTKKDKQKTFTNSEFLINNQEKNTTKYRLHSTAEAPKTTTLMNDKTPLFYTLQTLTYFRKLTDTKLTCGLGMVQKEKEQEISRVLNPYPPIEGAGAVTWPSAALHLDMGRGGITHEHDASTNPDDDI